MLDFRKDEFDLSSCYPMDASRGCMPLWVSTESHIQESSTTPSENLSLQMGNPSPSGHKVKQMDFLFRDKDSSSTQSSCESLNEVGSITKGNSSRQNFISAGPGYDHTLKHEVISQIKATPSVGNQDCFIPSRVNFEQSYDCVPLPYTDPYFGGLLTQNMHIQHTQMMGIAPARVPLPLDLLQNEPIYVNAKQYHAILRRRQYRAKLESQNKLSKGRKPYLHESRHMHALKRARGTGGRFINTKNLQNSNAPVTTTNNYPKSANFHSKVSDNSLPATSSSDITNASDNNNIYQHQEFRFFLHPSSIGSFYGENQRYLAVNQ